MLSMMLKKSGRVLELTEMPIPECLADQVLIQVSACAVCRTDLHIVDGELPNIPLPLIPGHQIVGKFVKIGSNVHNLRINDRVGVSWLGSTCEMCEYCNSDRENLCDSAKFTGYQINGGFAEYCVALAKHCYLIPENYSDVQAAPLLCAGAVGFRAYKMIGQAQKIGIYGFGSAAHILTQIAIKQGKQIYAFTREGDANAQNFALELGATWAGASNELPGDLLDAAIIFAPIGDLVPRALAAVKKGGKVVCGGIHMSEIPAFSYDLLWGERMLCSVANLTQSDGVEFLSLVAKIPVKTQVTTYSLQQTNEALEDLRNGKFNGAAVIVFN